MGENRRFADSQKNLRKSERHIKELSFAADEDRKNHERMQILIDQLQGKIKAYKKQIEEAEEIAALNLAKYRAAQGNLADAGERSDINSKHWPNSRLRHALGLLDSKLNPLLNINNFLFDPFITFEQLTFLFSKFLSDIFMFK